MRIALVIASPLLLAACQAAEQAEEAPASAEMAADAAAGAPAAAPAPASSPGRAAGPTPTPPPGAPQVPPAGLPMLAYEYDYQIEAPAEGARRLMRKHEQACLRAGPAVCQLVGASVGQTGDDEMNGRLSLRATPAWVAEFRRGLEGEARSAGGRVRREEVSTEDLSRQIVDTEARIRATTTLRDRLLGHLASRPGKLEELLAVEQELARVQGELDATQSALAVMRARVATSAVEIAYVSAGVLAPEGVFAPLGEAFGNVVRLFVLSLAWIIQALAFLLPIALLAGAAVWAFRRWGPKRKPRPAEPPQA
jgi:hypothetical protein